MTDIQLNHLADWYEEKTNGIIRPIKLDARKIVTSVRETVSSIEDVSARIALTANSMDMERKEPARYGQRFARDVSSSLKRANFPDNITYEPLQQLYESLLEVTDSINKAGRRCIPRLSPFFKDEVRALDYTVKKLAREIKSFQDFIQIDYVEVKRIEDVRRKIDEFINQTKRNEGTPRSIGKTQQRIQKMEEEMNEKLRRLEELRGEESFKRLKEIEIELKEIRDRFQWIFDPLEKPMKKMAKLIHNGDYTLEEEKKLTLNGFLTSPFESFVSMINHKPLKAFLSELNGLIQSGKLKLKKRRREKALKYLREVITIEALEGLKRKYKELQRKKERINDSINTDGTRSESEKINERVKKMKRELQGLKF
ncbi:hypothetical protein KAS14_04940, partial [Candidatus Bathyarchaeota archaeon]|nr:hypothetical protein [Candidatus Bathyarchaeota archaeon]